MQTGAVSHAAAAVARSPRATGARAGEAVQGVGCRPNNTDLAPGLPRAQSSGRQARGVPQSAPSATSRKGAPGVLVTCAP